MWKRIFIFAISLELLNDSVSADSWVGVTASGSIASSASSLNYCSDSYAPKGFSAGALWGTDMFKSFFLEAGGSYQRIYADRLVNYNLTLPGNCQSANQDYMYASYRQDFFIVSLMPGYKHALSESFALMFSAGTILNFNLGVTRTLVYFNKLSDPSLDFSIPGNTNELPLDEKEHTQTSSLVYQDFYTNIGLAGKISLAWQPPNSHYGLRLSTSVEKYASTGTSSPGVSLLTNPVTVVLFRITIDFLYRL